MTSRLCTLLKGIPLLLVVVVLSPAQLVRANGNGLDSRSEQATNTPIININVTSSNIHIAQTSSTDTFDLSAQLTNQGHTPHRNGSAGSSASSGSTVYVGPVQVSPFRLPQAGDQAGPCVGDGWAFAGDGHCASFPKGSISDIPGRHNVTTTRVDAHAVAEYLARQLDAGIDLPNIVLQVNPTVGITNIPSWYWPGSYGGEPIVRTAHQELPWQETWTVTVHHEDPCPTDDNPDATCSYNTEEGRGPEWHMDTVDVTVELDPARFTWDFGDGTAPAVFTDVRGVGRAYTDPKTPSPVAHNYQWSSLKHIDEGGFPIKLTANWSAKGRITVNSDLGGGVNESLTLDSRVGEWEARYQVREVRSVITQ
jgi:hypothetical protein